MTSRAVRWLAAVAGAAAGAAAVHYALGPLLGIFAALDAWVPIVVLVSIPLFCGAILFWLAPSLLASMTQLTMWLEGRLARVPLVDILVGSVGLIVGLIIATLFGGALARVPIVGSILAIVVSALLGYLGWTVGIRKREDMLKLLSSIRLKEVDARAARPARVPKLLDTSTIIDGRIADIYAAGFLEGPLVIPQFVLDELRHIADSTDSLKRNRGRRGLDVLNRLQKDLGAEVDVSPDDGEQGEVDVRLVNQAKKVGGKILTNDFNLNKVAELQGVEVLNINDLANALKPIVLPGETIEVQVIREGKESGQGVGYFDDGTMIVVEDGKMYIGGKVEVTVTSVLQTSAGRMIFAKSKAVAQRAL